MSCSSHLFALSTKLKQIQEISFLVYDYLVVLRVTAWKLDHLKDGDSIHTVHPECTELNFVLEVM